MNVYQRYSNLSTLTFSLFPPRGTCCKLPRKNGDCWSLFIIIIIIAVLLYIIIMIIYGKSLSFNSLHERPINAHPHKCRVFVVVANPTLFSEYLWALQVFLVHSAAWASSSFSSFFLDFQLTYIHFLPARGRPFWIGEKEICFFLSLHIFLLCLSLSQN